MNPSHVNLKLQKGPMSYLNSGALHSTCKKNLGRMSPDMNMPQDSSKSWCAHFSGCRAVKQPVENVAKAPLHNFNFLMPPYP